MEGLPTGDPLPCCKGTVQELAKVYGKSQILTLEMIRVYWVSELTGFRLSFLGVIPLRTGGNSAFWNDSGCTLWKGVVCIPVCELSLNRSQVEVLPSIWKGKPPGVIPTLLSLICTKNSKQNECFFQ